MLLPCAAQWVWYLGLSVLSISYWHGSVCKAWLRMQGFAVDSLLWPHTLRLMTTREKDGLWAVLAWLSILAHRNVAHEDLGSKLAKLAPGAPRVAVRLYSSQLEV